MWAKQRSSWRAASLALLLGLSRCDCRPLLLPQARLEQAVQALSKARSLPLGEALPPLKLHSFVLRQVLAQAELDPPRATGFLDLDGELPLPGRMGGRPDGGAGVVLVSVLGRERLNFQREGDAYVADPRVASNLTSVLEALWARTAARGDPGKFSALAAATYPGLGKLADAALAEPLGDAPKMWSVRLDVDRADVTEERVSGARLASVLVRDAKGYRFASGLVKE